jgi:hypothetical protein
VEPAAEPLQLHYWVQLRQRSTGRPLHGIGTNDPVIMAVVVLVILAPAAAAVLIPACRASRLDPMQVLRG